jgi:hypothetical protein
MLDKKFYGYNRIPYKVIKKHGSFENVWRCYPAHLKAPYDQQIIKCFSDDYINENLI